MIGKRIARRFFSAADAPVAKKTSLYDFHVQQGATMVNFAGYQMPLRYPLGTLKEHLHTRAASGIFDVSHMGQITIRGADATSFIERVSVADAQALKTGESSLTLLMTERGTIVDDCIVTKAAEDHYYAVINAGCKEKDIKHFERILATEFAGKDIQIRSRDEEQSLIAIQGPKAAHALGRLLGSDESMFSKMPFMTSWCHGQQHF